MGRVGKNLASRLIIEEELVPPAGLEPAHLAPEASALSAELQGRRSRIHTSTDYVIKLFSLSGRPVVLGRKFSGSPLV